MNYRIFYSILLFMLMGAGNSWAQMDATALSNKALEDSIARKASWQLTLDVIKAKSDAVFKKNLQLTQESQALLDQYNKQQEDINILRQQNEDFKQQLKDRRGRSDEQIQIDELQEQIKQKKEGLKDLQKVLNNLELNRKALEHKIELKKLKNSELLLQEKQKRLEKNALEQIKLTEVSEDDQELVELKQKFDHEKQQEKVLQKQIDDLKQTQSISSNNTQADNLKITELSKKVDFLTQQKEDLQKRLNSDNNQGNKARYQMLMIRKGELERKIKESEVQLNDLKHSPGLSLSDNKSSKALLKQMVQIDTKNKQLHHKVADLKEDILLLRTQVKRLERKAYQRSKITDSKK